MKLDIEQIATVAHEANRAFCATLGDFSQPEWNSAPQWQRDSAIDGVKFHLAALDRGEDPEPSASHENWLKQKRDDGWTYGPVKNPDLKQHPCFMPYNGLPVEQRAKDFIFAGIVKSVHSALLLNMVV